MSSTLLVFATPEAKPLFLVWGPPSHGPRSRVLARELGISDLEFVYCTSRRGLLAAPYKYGYQAAQTLRLLLRKRPKIVFVQSPPSFAVLVVALYCTRTHRHYVVDAHSAAFQHPFWTHPRWLHRWLARNAVTTLVTNERYGRLVNAWGGHALVFPDVPTRFPQAEFYPLSADFNVAVVNTFSGDEPLREILTAATGLEGFRFYVTGRTRNAPRQLLAEAPANVHFTDYLPDESYYALLAGSQAVMCLTTRDHTMQRGACEALWLGKPIITSDWPLLREYFHRGTVHVPNTGAGIRDGVLEMKRRYRQYQEEIRELQAAQRQQWYERVRALTDLVQRAIIAR